MCDTIGPRYRIVVHDNHTGDFKAVCWLSIHDFDRMIAQGELPKVGMLLANCVRDYEKQVDKVN
jgi:hypothetical protein